ncbi:MAG: hypothetical protein H8E20_04635 [Verrucomicrobia bacterium]|nr:hypothetical protein [Verrucomicrobiota bacterium]
MAKVIKKWRASDEPDADGVFVLISGRSSGLISWLMSLLGLDPTVTLTATGSRIEFSSTSLSGKQSILIPINKVNKTSYGYAKPWKAAIGYIVVFSALTAATLDASGMLAITLFIIGLLLGVVKYLFGKELTIGFGDGDDEHTIEFKRSLIENQNINEQQAEHVCELIQRLISNAGQ